MLLRRKFSASQFWDDCRRHDVTVIQYIGELCRFLVNREKVSIGKYVNRLTSHNYRFTNLEISSQTDQDSNHKVRLAIGNGLRSDIWTEFKNRFNVERIFEFYAATEGNAGFLNIANKDGSIGRCSPLLVSTISTHSPCSVVVCCCCVTRR